MNSSNTTHPRWGGIWEGLKTKNFRNRSKSTLERIYLESLAQEASINALGILPSLKKEVADQILETTGRIVHILQLPPIMNYEAIILMNPLHTNPILLSSTDDDRKQELFFYEMHRDIEHLLFPIIQTLLQLMKEKAEEESQNSIIKTLTVVDENLSKVIQKMSFLYRNLNKESFSHFRKFFTRIQFRNLDGEPYPGPSGASSAAFPTLDILFGIEQTWALSPIADEVRPKIAWRWYTTILEMNTAKDLVALHGNLFQKYDWLTWVDTALKKCVDSIKKFRINHKAQVEKFVPEALQWETTWTGWATNVTHYLDTMIENTKRRIA